MKLWKCKFETRKYGAIGIWEPREVIVKAATEEEARLAAIDEFHKREYETRFPLCKAEPVVDPA